jgi:hypothetical protein
MPTETLTKPVTTKDPTILYYYQPSGIDDRVLHTLAIVAKVNGVYEKIVLKRALNPMTRVRWEALIQSPQVKKLLETQQLFHVADSPNLIKDYIPNMGVTGAISIEALLDRCAPGMLLPWSIWIKNQEMTTANRYGDYLAKINQRLESQTNWLPPQPSNRPMNPAKAIDSNGQLGNI